MELTFARWDLVGDNLPSQPVLRVLADGVVATDAEHDDCFASPLVAAEAVWRVAGDKPASGSWLDAAYRALDGASDCSLQRNGTPASRIITSELLESGIVGWVNHKLSLAPTGIWALASQAGLPVAERPDASAELEPASPDHQLSGDHTAEWALVRHAVEAAGPPKAAKDSSILTSARPMGSDKPLSGTSAQEWSFAGNAGLDPVDE